MEAGSFWVSLAEFAPTLQCAKLILAWYLKLYRQLIAAINGSSDRLRLGTDLVKVEALRNVGALLI